MKTFEKAIQDIETTDNLLEKGLKLAGLVSTVLRSAGWDIVVVGGSAVEFYTEGAYMSGDIDLCRRSLTPIPPRKAQDLMAQLKASGGPRSWKIAGMFVDLLGFFENEARTPLRNIETPFGLVKIMPPELALVERVMLAYYPGFDENAEAVAKKMLAACLSGATPVDWDEVNRLAALSSFDIEKELAKLKRKTKRELEIKKKK